MAGMTVILTFRSFLTLLIPTPCSKSIIHSPQSQSPSTAEDPHGDYP